MSNRPFNLRISQVAPQAFDLFEHNRQFDAHITFDLEYGGWIMFVTGPKEAHVNVTHLPEGSLDWNEVFRAIEETVT